MRNSLLRRYAGGAAFPEAILEIAARETCRFDRREECATFFARWSFEHPGSTRRRNVLADLRMRAGDRNPDIAPARLRELRRLYGGPTRPEDGPLTAEAALLLTTRFLNYYHHAVPFDRRVIESAWERCEGPDCAARRRRIEAYLWGLGGDDARVEPPSTQSRSDR